MPVALALVLAVATASAPSPPRVAAIGHVLAREALPECRGERAALCLGDNEPRWSVRVGVDDVLRGRDLPGEVAVRVHFNDHAALDSRGKVLVIWTPGSDGAAEVYAADPRVDGGWGVCGALNHGFEVGPPLEPIALQSVFGNASRLSPGGIAIEFSPTYYDVATNGDVHCVHGWSTDTLIDFPAWGPQP